MREKAKWYLLEFFIIAFVALLLVGRCVVEVDPFFHYHKPDTEKYYYTLDNQRSQNDGISKRFDYNMLITETSMTENFKTTEAEEIWAAEGARAVKVSYSGGYQEEINDNLLRALENNSELRIVIRGLDMWFISDADVKWKATGKYPTYLYDDNIWNDVEYIFNKDVIFNRVYPMIVEREKQGITPFDEYTDLGKEGKFGFETVLAPYQEVPGKIYGGEAYLTEREKEGILAHVRQNIVSPAEEYPNVDFYYFFTPYSAVFWGECVQGAAIYRQVEAERLVIEEILKYDNIKLYSFSNRTDITTDLNNYKDPHHYGSWINSLMLKWMHDGKYRLTEENYEDYLAEELSFYIAYDYSRLEDQEDYENDYYAAALLNEELYGVTPLVITDEMLKQSEMRSARIVPDQYQGMSGVECRGCLKRTPDDEGLLSEYLMEKEYIGYKMEIEDMKDYKYLVFYGRKESGDGQPSVFLYDENKNRLAYCMADCRDLDNEWHQYLLDITDLEGRITIIFNGGCTDNTGSEYTSYLFSNVALY